MGVDRGDDGRDDRGDTKGMTGVMLEGDYRGDDERVITGVIKGE